MKPAPPVTRILMSCTLLACANRRPSPSRSLPGLAATRVRAGLVPEVFEVDDDDVLHIKLHVIPANLADSVRHAVRSCPKAALVVGEEHGECREQQQRPDAAVSAPDPTTAMVQRRCPHDSNGSTLLFASVAEHQQRAKRCCRGASWHCRRTSRSRATA